MLSLVLKEHNTIVKKEQRKKTSDISQNPFTEVEDNGMSLCKLLIDEHHVA